MKYKEKDLYGEILNVWIPVHWHVANCCWCWHTDKTHTHGMTGILKAWDTHRHTLGWRNVEILQSP